MKYPGPCAEAAWYRRSMPNEIGLVDENFSLSMEEENLHSVQGSPAGNPYIFPQASVIRRHGETPGVDSDISPYPGKRNLFWNTIKKFPARAFLIIGPFIVGKNRADIRFYRLKKRGDKLFKAKSDAVKEVYARIKKLRHE
jgi:hypothetical protein